MQQVEIYMAGERNYSKIRGDTGPLVYPALHVYVYRGLHALTAGGTDIRQAQIIFAILYLSTLAVVMQCYRLARAPPYIFPLLILSKRLHSIYLLRLFNDCFAVAGLYLAIYAYQRRRWNLGSVAYSCAVAIKMSALLALPAIGMILLQGWLLPSFFQRALSQGVLVLGLQLLFGLPFLTTSASSYFSRAFELTRVFMFKWTVNWRFVGEATFLTKQFSIYLLTAHLALLSLFVASRWILPSAGSLPTLTRNALRRSSAAYERMILAELSPNFILTAILTSNAIGMLCARSLHYQFYSWLAWGTPFLLWRTGLHPVLQYLLWAMQEWAWIVYPSTNASSIIVVLSLLLVVTGVWFGSGSGPKVRQDQAVKSPGSHQHLD
ncbi:MAG: dolichyl-P-Man:Man(5)GlcNAc(2)-PP-dolichol alpha-1,3-mannosyltransferase [Caeruleum heppii]|nr:MAG: dolichyl-P-Man:Man(5)GlcNAc(2)-PP-dolichol alpha-1,3-mannosyltransferase [Caeruleum heppii]